MSQRLLTIAFLSPNPDDDWVNRLTALASTHHFCHVELFFESLNLCFSVVWGEKAGFRAKNLSNPNYRVVSLSVTAREYDACLQFCQSVATQGLGFDNQGMWLAWCPIQPCASPSQQTGATFCSKIITEALQFAGLQEVEDLSPASATPSRLYESLRGSTRMVCGSVPFKRHAFMMFSSL